MTKATLWRNNMLNRHTLFISLLLIAGLGACTSPPQNCAADGPGCKQFNPELGNGAPPQNLPSPSNCAADGGNCKQFNPNL